MRTRHSAPPWPPPLSTILAASATPDGDVTDGDIGRIVLNRNGNDDSAVSSPLALAMPPPPPPVATAIAPSSPGGRRRASADAVSPPPLLQRRTLSHDLYGDQSRDPPRHGTHPAPRAEDDGDAAVHRHDDHDDHDEPARRHTLFATPTRRLRGVPNNRSRAVSCDIVLNISDDCLPRYCDDFASRMARISDVEVTDGMGRDGLGDAGPGAFSTPERRASPARITRDRAHTCPHRPQRHSMVPWRGRDEEAGWPLEGVPTRSVSSPTPGSLGAPPSPHDEEEPAAAHSSRQRSPERRGQWSPASPPVRRHAMSPPRAAPRLPAGMPLAARPSSPPPSLAPLDAASLGVPAVPPISHRSPRSSPAPSIPGAGDLPQPSSPTPNCCLRMPPALMKLLMVLSLYVLLAYTWNTDLKVRYLEINYGLSEYWHGEGGIRAETTKMSSRHHVARRGERSNDDGDVVIKLINNLIEEAEDSEETMGDDEEDTLSTLQPDPSSGRMKRRPSLSYARSSASFQRPRRVAATGAARARPPPPPWTLANAAWGLVWLAFLLPIVEVAARELRRQVHFRCRHRRLRSWRAAPGRAPNARDL